MDSDKKDTDETPKIGSKMEKGILVFPEQKADCTLLTEYENLSLEMIQKEVGYYKQVESMVEKDWEVECKQYEEMVSIRFPFSLRRQQVPRRNYANNKGVVSDPTLFPYHTSCYALLDAYGSLYENKDDEPIAADAIAPSSFPPERAEEMPIDDDLSFTNYLPCSVQSIAAAVLNLKCFGETEIQRFQLVFTFFDKILERLTDGDQPGKTWDNTILRFARYFRDPNRIEGRRISDPPEGWRIADPVECGPVPFPTDRAERVHLLLRLLKHSLSEIQRDHQLAIAVLIRLMRDFELDDVSVMRSVLCILESEYIACTNFCEDADHICADWQDTLLSMSWLLCCGVTWTTQEHATAIAGFVRHLLLREFGHMLDEEGESSAGFENQLKKQLKQRVVASRYEEDADAEGPTAQAPYLLIIHIVVSLGLRANSDRHRLIKLVNEEANDGNDQSRAETLANSLDSFFHCLSALVSVADSLTEIAPNAVRFHGIASQLVLSFVHALALPQFDIWGNPDHHVPKSYLGRAPCLKEQRMCEPFRFANAVRHATARARAFDTDVSSSAASSNILFHTARMAALGRPHQHIKAAVRNLFVRNLVDVSYAKCGYGDFLLWCRYEIDALDPVLFWQDCNLPREAEEDSDDEVDENEEEREIDFDEDETGLVLLRGDMEARFDLNLLTLVCAWNDPWTPESHMSFQPDYRQAVHAVVLCLHRLHMPKELLSHIAQFLPREYWPDDRKQCWQYDCMLAEVAKTVEDQTLGGAKPRSTLTPCKKCQVAYYCCKGCREQDYKESHKRACSRPPFCIPGKLERNFCTLIESGQEETLRRAEDEMDDEEWEDDDNDDDGSWESMDSDEDGEEPRHKHNRTQQIYQFFYRNTYRFQR